MPKIAITGVTGNLGGMVSRLCKKNGIEVRNLARNVEKAEKLGFSNVFKSSYDKSEDTVKSLEGIKALFMVSGSENPNRIQQHKDFIDAAKIAGVSHIIYLSFYNASKNSPTFYKNYLPFYNNINQLIRHNNHFHNFFFINKFLSLF